MIVGGGMWVDRRMCDRHGVVVGLIVGVYDAPETHRPFWLAVATGFFGTRIGVVPLRGASLLGEDVIVPHDHQTISSAPQVSLVAEVTRSDHDHLTKYYRQSGTTVSPPHRP